MSSWLSSSVPSPSPSLAVCLLLPAMSLSLLDCLRADGSIDVSNYFAYLRQKRDRDRQIVDHLDVLSGGDDEDYDDVVPGPPPEPRRRAPRMILARRDSESGPLVVIPPEESLWYRIYVNNHFILENSRLRAKFRLRFRLPYENYKDLVDWVRVDPLFDRWCGYKIKNKKCSPVELLVLGALRYLGRGWTLDDIEECTAVSKEVHRVFFHAFIKFGSTTLYERMVTSPASADEASSHMAEYAAAGLPGCIGSIDCTHIVTERCEYSLKNNHLGFKSSNTTRTYNLTCNHRRRILHSTAGGPGRWNDQTMVRLDQFISRVRDGLSFEDHRFQLESFDERLGKVIQRIYSGVYVICDNGYLDWSCTVPPFTMTSQQDEIRWSKWLESMRKDVECTFGIMKG